MISDDWINQAIDRNSVLLRSGKPGLLCVEGDGHQVDRYMSKIKSESWRDIPPSHKKVCPFFVYLRVVQLLPQAADTDVIQLISA